MADRPTAPELVEAAREFLESEILPTLDDHRLKFRTLVAMNALAIAGRELTNAEPEPGDAELRELARRIRAGEPPEGALALLKEHVTAKLRVASPRYLDRYR
jgi:hypothetical protein